MLDAERLRSCAEQEADLDDTCSSVRQTVTTTDRALSKDKRDAPVFAVGKRTKSTKYGKESGSCHKWEVWCGVV